MNKNKFEDNSVSNSDIDKCYTVYMHISPSGKRYIGITRQEQEKRWKNGNGYKSQKYFYKAISKYGWNNFKHEVLFSGLTKEEAEQKEMWLIALYQSDNYLYGYNIEHGGSSVGRMSNATKKKLSDINKKENLSEETLKKRRVALTGRILSNAHKQKMHEVWYNSHKESLCKSVSQYTKDGVFIRTWTSAGLSAKTLKLNKSTITQCCKGKRKTTGGFIWKYSNDVLSYDEIYLRNTKIYNNKKGVIQYSKDGDVIKKYASVAEASLITGIKEKNIYRCCGGERKYTGGYAWEYIG